MAAFKRVAESLLALRRQVNEMAPGRDTSSDGTLGDQAHQIRNSDHNPDDDGIVTAMDITHDPAHGVDAGMIAEMLRISQDKRIKYVISNRRIFSSKVSPWQWRTYSGANAHTKHVHVSVMDDKALYDDTSPWAISKIVKVQPETAAQPSGRLTNITATMFGGSGDPEKSAYDGHLITDEEFGVSLPAHIKQKPLPKVRVINSSTRASVICDVVDVGPWNTDDPYWETGTRPQAETGTDHSGRKTNGAGVDLTPAADRAIGNNGKGKVDWEFVGATAAQTGGTTMPTSTSDIASVLQQVLGFLQALNKPQTPAPGPEAPQPSGTSTTTNDDLQKILQIITTILGNDDVKKALGPVNGALGDTIGNLLNGKKTAVGLIGSLITAVLQGAPGLSGSLSTALGLGSTALGPVMLPIFLAIGAWGILGKLEKWSQTTPTPPK